LLPSGLLTRLDAHVFDIRTAFGRNTRPASPAPGQPGIHGGDLDLKGRGHVRAGYFESSLVIDESFSIAHVLDASGNSGNSHIAAAVQNRAAYGAMNQNPRTFLHDQITLYPAIQAQLRVGCYGDRTADQTMKLGILRESDVADEMAAVRAMRLAHVGNLIFRAVFPGRKEPLISEMREAGTGGAVFLRARPAR
jgi:hypothetical protein